MTNPILYDDGAVKISHSRNSYSVEFRGASYVFPKDVFEDMARSGESNLISKLKLSAPRLLKSLERVPVIYQRFGLCVAHARIAELESQAKDPSFSSVTSGIGGLFKKRTQALASLPDDDDEH